MEEALPPLEGIQRFEGPTRGSFPDKPNVSQDMHKFSLFSNMLEHIFHYDS